MACKNSEDDSNVGKIRPGLASIGSESKALRGRNVENICNNNFHVFQK